ncbi:MAG: MerR family transcriptional regulator [Acidimicrobiales bacterium]
MRYYDQLGLLKPQARSAAGYRLYGQEDLLRLREILIWRRLGFPLADIAALIDDPGHDRSEALRRQLALSVGVGDYPGERAVLDRGGEPDGHPLQRSRTSPGGLSCGECRPLRRWRSTGAGWHCATWTRFSIPPQGSPRATCSTITVRWLRPCFHTSRGARSR